MHSGVRWVLEGADGKRRARRGVTGSPERVLSGAGGRRMARNGRDGSAIRTGRPQGGGGRNYAARFGSSGFLDSE